MFCVSSSQAGSWFSAQSAQALSRASCVGQAMTHRKSKPSASNRGVMTAATIRPQSASRATLAQYSVCDCNASSVKPSAFWCQTNSTMAGTCGAGASAAGAGAAVTDSVDVDSPPQAVRAKMLSSVSILFMRSPLIVLSSVIGLGPRP